MDTGKYDILSDDDIDPATGEFPAPDREPQPEPEPEPQVRERYESVGAEIIPRGHERAADGAIMQTVAHTAGNFVDMLEDGRYSEEVNAQLRSLAETMTAITQSTGNKTKGRVTLTIDLEKEGEHFSVRAKVATKAPELPRPKSIVWSDHAGNFTRFPPQQTQMFGMRPARNVG